MNKSGVDNLLIFSCEISFPIILSILKIWVSSCKVNSGIFLITVFKRSTANVPISDTSVKTLY